VAVLSVYAALLSVHGSFECILAIAERIDWDYVE